ncbi:MAG: hypothetical protein M0Z85_08705 [Gammaproteobacteria bacterium]|nr:hypothetical protein [Gammaproteobacteria bacterium]
MSDPGTTGVILNRGGVALVITANNVSDFDQQIELEVFSVPVSSIPVAKVGAAHQLFTVPPQTVVTRKFDITGFPAWEFQASTPLNLNVFATDAAGNLIAAERVLDSEAYEIAALTPMP